MWYPALIYIPETIGVIGVVILAIGAVIFLVYAFVKEYGAPKVIGGCSISIIVVIIIAILVLGGCIGCISLVSSMLK